MSSADSKDGEKVSLDRILVEELGQFGRYQLITLLLAILPTVFWGFTTSEYVFTTARIPSRCLIPECDGADPDFAAPWRDVAIPQLASGAFDQCSRFGSNSSNTWTVQDDSCPATLFNTSITQRCEQLVYQHNNTIVHDFDLGCDEWRRSLVGSIRTMGALLALPLTGYVSDRWGRRVALAINVFNSGFIGLLLSFASSYEWFVPLSFIEAILGNGTFSCCFMLTIEIVGPKYRVLAGAMIATITSLSHVILGLLAWCAPHWRTFMRIVYGPQLLFVFYTFTMSESIRWLLTTGRYEQAEKVLQKIALYNKKTLSEKSLKALQASAESENRVRIKKPKETWLLLQIIRSPVIFRMCIITSFWFITNFLTYYGMAVNAVNLSGNSYLNYSLVGFMDLPGRWSVYFLLDRVGRRPFILVAYIICGVCQFTFSFLPEGMPALSLAAYLIAKSCIAAISTSVHIYVVELYPTVHRHKLYGFGSMMGRLGAIAAPLMPSLAQEIWSPLPSVLFGSFALVSALLVLVTPETLGVKMPETMEDAEDIGKPKTFKTTP